MNMAAAFAAPAPLTLTPHTASARLTSRRRSHQFQAVLHIPESNSSQKRICASIARDFLTRRAVHTALYYYAELHDAPTQRWLLDFDRFGIRDNQDLFFDSDAYLTRMIRAPSVPGVIHTRQGRLTRKHTFTIEPPRVARAVLAAREQLATEWAADLPVIRAENAELLRAACERLIEPDARARASRENIVFSPSDGSPLRGRNLQLCTALLTQHAVARILPFLRGSSNAEYVWLAKYLAGNGAISDGKTFLRRMLGQEGVQDKYSMRAVDPRGIAVQIMDMRGGIADEWVQAMRGVVDEQDALLRSLLERALQASLDCGEDNA